MVGMAAFLLLIFLLQNTEIVSVTFLFWQLSISRILLIPLLILLGFLLGFIVAKRTGGTRIQRKGKGAENL